MAKFNIEQLATWAEATKIVKYLNSTPVDGKLVGNGVPPQVGNPLKSGIFIPFWVAGPGGYQQPYIADPVSGNEYFFLHLRFGNKAEGINVGLVRGLFERYPSEGARMSALRHLSAEVDQNARS